MSFTRQLSGLLHNSWPLVSRHLHSAWFYLVLKVGYVTVPSTATFRFSPRCFLHAESIGFKSLRL